MIHLGGGGIFNIFPHHHDGKADGADNFDLRGAVEEVVVPNREAAVPAIHVVGPHDRVVRVHDDLVVLHDPAAHQIHVWAAHHHEARLDQAASNLAAEAYACLAVRLDLARPIQEAVALADAYLVVHRVPYFLAEEAAVNWAVDARLEDQEAVVAAILLGVELVEAVILEVLILVACL